ncbi:HAMP domain-containing methyl-accepting chemotaxis protein [Sphingomonas quercus]|uniref:Methyl-accepting chemotaxis protein n=1 Tax=Sphingomonas quercus TaxID=2842451 RepID=A0ABS6BGA4_9SPHN|nr:HAMP domain-containing methyl-accepting chemotaxis protein [Sphingomonas quercus]MBU3077325.1 methyl-accepting chemotaxis protein [Sphingomonas quercus]
MNLPNMPISKKIMVALGLFVFLCAGLTAFAVNRMNVLATNANRLGTVLGGEARLFAGVSENLTKMQQLGFETIVESDPVRRATLPGEIEEEIKALNQRFEELHAIIPDEDKALVSSIEDGAAKYEESLRKSVALAVQNKDQEAEDIIQDVAGAQYDKLDTPLDKVRKEKKEALNAGVTEAAAIANTALWSMLGVATFGLISIGIIALTIVRRQIVRPLIRINGIMTTLAAGDNTVEVAHMDRLDEIGSMAKTVLVFRDAAIAKERSDADQKRVVESVATSLNKLSAGDLTVRLADFPPSYAQLEHDFNSAVEGLRQTMISVNASAVGIQTGAGEVREASNDLSQRTEQQAASLEETAAAMNEITSTVQGTAESASTAKSVVEQARGDAEESGIVVQRTVDAMNGIERSSQEISEIISVIDGIAFQTNLLALNAGVEAARAGDAGKGFAVVASEVRALAQRSADAAKDVKEKINASGQQVQAGVQLVGETGQALTRIIERVKQISEHISKIAAGAEQQATGLQQVNTAVSEMDGVTQQNAAMVEEATAAARSLASEAEQLAHQVAQFKLGESGSGPTVASQPRSNKVQKLHTRVSTGSHGRMVNRGNLALASAPAVGEDDWSAF